MKQATGATAPASKKGARATKRAVIYARVSTMAQARTNEGDGYSLEAQLAAGHGRAVALGAEVVDVYVDRGTTAKTIARKAFQQMMERIRTAQDVDVVITHKLDRWARNRRDDANMTYELEQAGVELVSVSENIDATPAGRLLHGVLASINQFYSENLTGEILKGSVQKAKNGGTPHRVRLGYLNVRTQGADGREMRTVEVDPERAPLIRYAFEQFASGEVTLRSLLADVTAKGLRTRPTPKQPSKPLTVSRLANLLHSAYYCGVVSYRGVQYQGTHEAIIDWPLYDRVQEVFKLHDKAGDRRRVHDQYLKGSVFCGRCGSRLVITKANGQGGTYLYYFCGGRQRGNGCTQPYVLVDAVEEAVIDFYRWVELTPERQAKLRRWLADELQRSRKTANRDGKRLRSTLATLKDQRMKLLEAHYAGAIPLDLLKQEQDRISREQKEAERQLGQLATDHVATEAVLTEAIGLAGNCQAVYRAGTPEERRLMNQAFFVKLFLDADEVTDFEWTKPFATLLAADLSEQVQAEAEQSTEGVFAGRSSEHNEPWSIGDQGSNKNILVEFLGVHSRHRANFGRVFDLAADLRRRPLGSPSPRRAKQRQRRLKPDEVACLVAEYEAGALVRDLADRFSVHRETVGLQLDRAGVHKRRQGLNADDVEEAERLYQTGWSLAKVGQHFQVDASTVWRAFRAAGVPTRPRTGFDR